MPNKKILFLLALLTISIFVIVADAQTSPDTTAGGINEETGLPKSFDKYQEMSENLSKEEQRKEYLKQEWTKIFANNKFLSPIFFYTNKFFTFFNPFWKIIFGVEFSWSWFFILSIGIFIMLIIFIYYPIKSLFNLNVLIALVISFIIASLIGITGAIKEVVNFLTFLLSNIWLVLVALVVIVLVSIIYSKFMKRLEEKSEKEEVERAKEKIKAYGEISKKALGALTEKE